MGKHGSVGCIIRARSGTLVAFLCVALLVPAGIASAGRAHRASVASEVQSAGKLAGKISRSRFAPHERAQLLAAARRAVRLARTKRTCAALAAADAFLNALNAPTTWHKRQIPKRLVRKPLSLLAGASRSLLHAAGRKCARAAAVHKLVPHTGGAGSSKVQPPATDPEQGGGLNHPIPPGKTILPKTIGGGSALGADPHGGLSSAADPLARIATPTLSFFRNSDVGVPPRTASPQEPTTAIAPAAGVVWYTGNTSDALSTDNGRTFTTFDPSNVLPDQGLAYCCDQVVSYSPQYNIFVWVSQYWCNKSCLVSDGQNPPHNVCRTDGVFNRIRIAVATPQALRANASNPGAAWTYWDITPGTVGQPGNAWFDRSDMSVNPWNMNWGVDIICGNSGNLLSRISLAQLAARGTVTLSYITDNGARTTSQGLGTTTTYFAGSNSGSQARIWSWAPFSGTLFRHDINHSSVPIYNNAINGTDHGNWYDRYGIFPGEVESATISGNTLYTAMGTGRAYCTANCSTNSPTLNQVFNEPAVLITKYDVNTWAETGERWLWNPTLAFGWPALSTDVAGDVGIALRTSADNQNAQPVAGFLTPSEQFFYADPAGQPYETGDYYSLRPGRTNQSFVMTAQTVETDAFGNPQMHWQYIEYGHGPSPYVAPPSVQITAPADHSSFTQGTSVTYSANVNDPVDGTLPNAAIVWAEDGSAIGSGPTIHHIENTIGTHTITVTATNGDGKSASQSITIGVNAPPVKPLPPSVAITAPPNGDRVSCRTSSTPVAVQFTATASDPNSPPESLTYSWTDSINGGAPSQVSTQLSPSLNLACDQATPRGTTHELTVTATNTSGESASAQVQVIAALG